MKNATTNVMSCGACAVVMDETGNVTTSVDRLVRGLKHMMSHRGESGVTRVAAATR